jgi:uncharacterized protein involved in exopolysaccharide biosynthesis
MNNQMAIPADSEGEQQDPEDGGVLISEIFATLRERWILIAGGSLLIGLLGLGVAFVIPPTYTARTAFLPPQQQQSTAAAALSSLGALAGLAGGAAGIKTPADQYIALLSSVSVSNRIIDQFKLIEVYDSKYRVDAQKELAKNVRIGAGKKDGIISVEVDDESPQRSADMANSYVDALRALTTTLAVTEAQQRRVFFEQQLVKTKDKLTQAQVALQETGFNPGAIKAEPKAAAEGYAKLRAEITAGEVKLSSLRSLLADNSPEISQQLNVLDVLRRQMSKLEAGNAPSSLNTNSADYIGRYREFKYQETLFDLFARQYELARVDESREGALIQVVDPATPPERKSKPRRGLIAIGATGAALLVLSIWVLVRARRPKV